MFAPSSLPYPLTKAVARSVVAALVLCSSSVHGTGGLRDSHLDRNQNEQYSQHDRHQRELASEEGAMINGDMTNWAMTALESPPSSSFVSIDPIRHDDIEEVSIDPFTTNLLATNFPYQLKYQTESELSGAASLHVAAYIQSAIDAPLLHLGLHCTKDAAQLGSELRWVLTCEGAAVFDATARAGRTRYVIGQHPLDVNVAVCQAFVGQAQNDFLERLYPRYEMQRERTGWDTERTRRFQKKEGAEEKKKRKQNNKKKTSQNKKKRKKRKKRKKNKKLQKNKKQQMKATGIAPQVSRVEYLASNGPIAARVRRIDAGVADGYASCADFKDDIAEALKHYANTVIVQEARPWNDWYEKCDCESDAPCRHPWGYYGTHDVHLAAMESTTMESAPTLEPEDSFGTNNQVDGVDEGDIVKSDGEHVYAAYGDVIYAWGADDGREGASITRMPYEAHDDADCPTPPRHLHRGRRKASFVIGPDPCHQAKPRILSLLLHGSRLTAIVSEEKFRSWWYHEPSNDDMDPILQDHAKLTVRVYDVSSVPTDGSPLVLLGEKEIKGNFDSARSVAETGVVITTSYLNIGSFANDLYRHHPRYCGLNSTEYQELAAEIAVNNSAPFTDRMAAELDVQLDGTCDGMFQIAAMQSGDSDEDRSNDGVLLSQFVRVLSFDMAADFVDRDIATHVGGAFSSGGLSSVYASQNFAATLNVGSNYDSDTGDWNQATFVLGFDISGTVPKPFGYAEIPGSPLNQYSTDLYQDHLRVVTTENNWSLQSDRTKNKIFVLKLPEASENASSEMIKVGESGHVGKPNESVYSVRFIGPRAYIVTFERTDPFYIYDLSNPTDPTKLGALEIPGFSSYLHPIVIEGVSFILGIGEHVDEESQRRTGVKISLFDISDEANPRENATFVDEGAYSTANNDFKAFRYLPQSQKLILPKRVWSWGERDNFDGFRVYDVRLGEIAAVHEIQHAQSYNMFHGCWYDAYMPARSLVFQSKLTTILSHSVISTDLADGAQLWSMDLDEGLNNTVCSPYFYGF